MEEGEDFTFDPTGVSLLGTVPQIFALVQPWRGKWRLSFFTNVNIKGYAPAPPNAPLALATAKQLLLTRCTLLSLS